MAEQSAPALELSSVSKFFDSTEAMSDVTFEVEPGEIFTLLGPSGCGKSTTLRVVAGLERPTTGRVVVHGRTVVDISRGHFVPPNKRNMGMVFQSYAVWPHITVFENVAFPLKLRRMKGSQIKERVHETLKLVGLLHVVNHYPWQLSGGMQQRVALARAIVYEPDILLLDEPLSNLDAKLREQMRLELRTLQKRLGTTFLFVTHDQTEAMVLSSRIAVMSAGQVEQIGTPLDVYQRPATPFARDFLGQTILLEGIARHRGSEIEVELDLGASVDLATPAVPANNGGAPEPAVEHGAQVLLACRTECVGLRPASESGGRWPVGTVEDVTFLGSRYEYIIRAGDKVLQIPGSGNDHYAVGSQVCLCFENRGITVWPHGD